MADADLVLSVNSSHDAMTALENALPALRAGHAVGRPQHRQPRAEGRAGRAGGGARRPGRRRRADVAGAGQGPAHADAGVGRGGRPVRRAPRRPGCRRRGPAGPGGDGDLAQAAAQRLLQGARGRRRGGAARCRGGRLRRLAARRTSPRSSPASTSAPSTGWSTARTPTPGAGPTRWPPPPSSCGSSACRPAIAPAARDLLVELRDAPILRETT